MNNPSTLNSHYAQLLNLISPWIVTKVDMDVEQAQLIIFISTLPGAKLPCPTCQIPCAKEDHREERSWRHLDTMQFATIIRARIPRISCPEHGILSVNVPWAGAYSRFTELFERFAVDVLMAAKSIKAAGKLLRLSWDQIQEIEKRAVERGLLRRDDKEIIKHVGIDEKSFLKGHSYISTLTDIGQGRVLEVVQDHTEIAATELLNKLTEEQKPKVEAVAMDMWPAFMNAAGAVLPQADIVHDKYHVSSYLSKAVDKVRCKENNSLSKQGNNGLKGTKYLWLTSPDNWSKENKSTFRQLAVDELKVGRAWSIKETFRHFWYYSYRASAESFFKKWYFWATHSKLKAVIVVAKMLKRHLNGILSYLKHHITNAVTEGLNSKIQSIKSNARGFRNFNNYRIAILFHCGKLNLYP